MPCWYYDKKEIRNSPSASDGIDYETECRYRREGARLIFEVGNKIQLGHNTMATGVVYFHRFYMFHSFKMFPRYVTACCCLFLAGKVEETPKKCKDIIKTTKDILSDEKFATFGEDPKEEVMTLERILLQTIKFDLQVEHPYTYLLRYAKCLKGDKEKLEKMLQMAWTFVNDSLCTTLSLQWEPEIIAVALMYLAGKLSKFEVIDWKGRTPKHLRWWDMFVEDITMDLLEDICHQVLDLYSPQTQNTNVPESPPYVPKSITPPLNDSNGKKPSRVTTPIIANKNGTHNVDLANVNSLKLNSKEIIPGPSTSSVLTQNGKSMKVLVPPVDNNVHYNYGYQPPPISGYPPAFSTPMPTIGGPISMNSNTQPMPPNNSGNSQHPPVFPPYIPPVAQNVQTQNVLSGPPPLQGPPYGSSHNPVVQQQYYPPPPNQPRTYFPPN